MAAVWDIGGPVTSAVAAAPVAPGLSGDAGKASAATAGQPAVGTGSRSRSRDRGSTVDGRGGKRMRGSYANRSCENCRKAHTACGEQRPCHRCQRLNKQCVDLGGPASSAAASSSPSADMTMSASALAPIAVPPASIPSGVPSAAAAAGFGAAVASIGPGSSASALPAVVPGAGSDERNPSSPSAAGSDDDMAMLISGGGGLTRPVAVTLTAKASQARLPGTTLKVSGPSSLSAFATESAAGDLAALDNVMRVVSQGDYNTGLELAARMSTAVRKVSSTVEQHDSLIDVGRDALGPHVQNVSALIRYGLTVTQLEDRLWVTRIMSDLNASFHEATGFSGPLTNVLHGADDNRLGLVVRTANNDIVYTNRRFLSMVGASNVQELSAALSGPGKFGSLLADPERRHLVVQRAGANRADSKGCSSKRPLRSMYGRERFLTINGDGEYSAFFYYNPIYTNRLVPGQPRMSMYSIWAYRVIAPADLVAMARAGLAENDYEWSVEY